MTTPNESRQLRWRKKMRAENRCEQCGQKKGRSPYASHCLPCARVHRKAQQKRRGGKPWREGSRGRRPKTAD